MRTPETNLSSALSCLQSWTPQKSSSICEFCHGVTAGWRRHEGFLLSSEGSVLVCWDELSWDDSSFWLGCLLVFLTSGQTRNLLKGLHCISPLTCTVEPRRSQRDGFLGFSPRPVLSMTQQPQTKKTDGRIMGHWSRWLGNERKDFTCLYLTFLSSFGTRPSAGPFAAAFSPPLNGCFEFQSKALVLWDLEDQRGGRPLNFLYLEGWHWAWNRKPRSLGGVCCSHDCLHVYFYQHVLVLLPVLKATFLVSLLGSQD